jgi:hypothetical protein
VDQRVENRGGIEQLHVIDRQWRVVSFAPDSIFAFLRAASNAYGTAQSRIDILRAVAPGEGYITVAHHTPAATVCWTFLAGRGSRKCSRRSKSSKRWASIPPTPHPTIGAMFTTACPPVIGRNLSHGHDVTPGCGASG